MASDVRVRSAQVSGTRGMLLVAAFFCCSLVWVYLFAGGQASPDTHPTMATLRGQAAEPKASPVVVEEHAAVKLASGPAVAFLVMGLEPGSSVPWASARDPVVEYQPPKDCGACPKEALQAKETKGEAKDYSKAAPGWWCAQRYYLDGLAHLLSTQPHARWYFLADADTLVFPDALHRMVDLLDANILDPAEDAYLGHGAYTSFIRFIMSGGGALIRGQSLRRMNATGTLLQCRVRQQKGAWCLHHLDWVVGECLREVGVEPTGHDAFQQMIDVCAPEQAKRGLSGFDTPADCCRPPRVACHPVKDPSLQQRLLKEHEEHFRSSPASYSVSWAMPCPWSEYWWESYWNSNCTVRPSHMRKPLT